MSFHSDTGADNMLAMTYDVAAKLMPFHVIVDASGLICAAGPPLLKLLGPSRIIDVPFFDVFRLNKPRRLDPASGVSAILGKRLTANLCDLSEEVSSRVFGVASAIVYAGVPSIFVAFTPSVNARTFIQEHGLKISDFGPVDGCADVMPLVAMQEDMLKDSRKKSEKLLAARDAAERLAFHDVLTGLPNRRALMAHLDGLLGSSSLSVIHLDLDKFRHINDRFGQAAGDAVLRHTVTILDEASVECDFWARLGGDEFVGVVPQRIEPKALSGLGDRLLAKIAQPFRFEGKSIDIAASLGLVSTVPGEALSADQILRQVDLALHDAKRDGGRKCVLFTPELLQTQTKLQMLSEDIRRGLEKAEFQAYLQPQIDARTGAFVCVEALARWQHADQGLLEPGYFLDHAEKAGLIQEIDAQVRNSAFDILVAADEQGLHIPKISLNTTLHDLIDPNHLERVLFELATRDIDPSRVVIEIVESVMFDEDSIRIVEACNAFVEEGFALALDDFGTGHASALSLVNLPLSIVKIDRAFSAGVARDKRREAMARSLVGMSHTLGLYVVAEGVANKADIQAFQNMGCHLFQAFLCGRPMSQADFFEFARRRAKNIA